MTEAKTKVTLVTFDSFLEQSVAANRHADCRAIAAMMQQATGEAAVMWGAIVGFGRYRYKYASGREGEWPLAALSPRKNDLTLYVAPEIDRFEALLAKLGPHKTGKVCLYIKRLADIDIAVLNMIIDGSVKAMAHKRV